MARALSSERRPCVVCRVYASACLHQVYKALPTRTLKKITNRNNQEQAFQSSTQYICRANLSTILISLRTTNYILITMPRTSLNGFYRSFKARHLSKSNSDQYITTTEDGHAEDSASVLSDATTLAQSKTGPQKGTPAQQGPDSLDYGSTRYCKHLP